MNPWLQEGLGGTLPASARQHPKRLVQDASNSGSACAIAASAEAQACSGHRQHQRRVLDHWQIEVTGGGRIWYLVDPDKATVWIDYAGPAHPKATD
jgi:hypothetical protein